MRRSPGWGIGSRSLSRLGKPFGETGRCQGSLSNLHIKRAAATIVPSTIHLGAQLRGRKWIRNPKTINPPTSTLRGQFSELLRSADPAPAIPTGIGPRLAEGAPTQADACFPSHDPAELAGLVDGGLKKLEHETRLSPAQWSSAPSNCGSSRGAADQSTFCMRVGSGSPAS